MVFLVAGFVFSGKLPVATTGFFIVAGTDGLDAAGCAAGLLLLAALAVVLAAGFVADLAAVFFAVAEPGLAAAFECAVTAGLFAGDGAGVAEAGWLPPGLFAEPLWAGVP